MKRAIALILIAFLSTIGCETQADKDARKKAEADMKLTIVEVVRDEQDKLHEANVDLARTLLGDRSAFVLAQCYTDGYDSVQKDDHTFRNAENLGPKYVAKCDSIAKAVKKHSDAETQRHQKEISQ